MSLFWTPAPALASLSMRRALPPLFVAWCTGVIVLLALRDWAPPAALLGAPGAGAAQEIARGLARQGLWSGVAIAIVPLFVLRAARTVGNWRTGDVDWLGSRAAPRATILVWTWLGWLASALLVLAAAGVAAEALAGRSAPGLRLSGEIGERGSAWVDGRRALTWRARDPLERAPPGSRARFELALGASSGPGAQVILSARRIDGASRATSSDDAASRPESRAETRVEQRVGTRSDIEIELPPGAGDIELALQCGEDSDRVLLVSKYGALWTPVASDRLASWTLLARTSLALAAWLALAIGLGAWMQSTSAAALLLSLMLPLWMALEPSAVWPGADLVEALAIAGRGRVPPAIGIGSLAASACAVVLGLALARWSLVRWRREA